MSSNYVIKKEIRRTWYGSKQIVYVLYDLNGKEHTKADERWKLELVKHMFDCIDAEQE